MAALTNDQILEAIASMTVLECSELVKAMEEKFGVTAAAPVAVAAAPVEEEAPKGPVNVTVVLTNPGQTKVAVIKAVQGLTGKSLLEAKKLVDSCPAVIKENIPTTEADEIKAKLIDAGAEVEVK